MQLIGQKNCGCTCRNMTEWGPVGPGLPEGTCPACSGAGAYDVGTGTGSPPYDGGAPCEFIAFFDCPLDYTHDGLVFAGPYVYGMPMLADRLVEESCEWTARKMMSWMGTGSVADCDTALAVVGGLVGGIDVPARQYFASWLRECKHGVHWVQRAPGVTYPSYVVGRVPDQALVQYETPQFGCECPGRFESGDPFCGFGNGTWDAEDPAVAGTYFNNGYTNSIEGTCGWFDLLNQLTEIGDGARVITNDYVECLHNATRVMWRFNIDSGTLKGYTDSDEEVVYSGTVICGARTTMTLTSGQSWAPKKVCVVPGRTRFITPCTDKENAVTCCDSGVMITEYASEFPGCGIPLTAFDARRYRDVDSIPDNIAPGTDLMKAEQGSVASSCGVFYGYWTFNCATKPPPLSCIGAPVLDAWGSRQYVFHQLTWCEAGAWKASIFCYGVSLVEGNTIFEQIFTTICMNVATTLIQCHPIFGHTWTCDIPGTYTLPFVPYPSGSGTGTGYYDCVTRHPCCCSAATVDFPCCEDPVNQALFLDLSAAGCADLDGKGADLTYQGTFTTTVGDGGTNRLYWTGSFDGGACGTLYVLWHISNTGGCDSVLTISNTADFTGVCFTVNDQVSCPFTSKTYVSTPWNNGVCPCCSGNVIATVAA